MGVAKRKQMSAIERCFHFPPFLVHVALVLTVGWIASRLDLNLPFVFTAGFAYLYFVEGRLKAKTESRIRSEERRANDRKRLLSDAETARWLNSTVEAIWPIFMENFASQKFLMSLAPWFLAKYKPRIAKTVILQKICLGRNSPVFSMLRCGRNPTDGDHLVLEMDMRFEAAEDMSAIIAVQMRKRVGLGIWTSLNVSNIQIEGKLHVGVRFTKGWPVVERLRVSFSEPPILRMTAKPIINYGIDVTDLPGIASWVDKMIADALEQSLVEPNMLVVDVKKLVGSMMAVNAMLQSPSGATVANPGDWFRTWNSTLPLVAILTVEILDGKKMKPCDPNGKADPYVKVQLGSTKFQTEVRHKTLQPAWHQTFHFPVVSWDLPNKLHLRVLDKDRFGHDDDMGFAEIDCEDFNDGQRHEMEVTLEGVKTGQIRIAITAEVVRVPDNATEEKKDHDSLQSGNAENGASLLGKKSENSDSSKGVLDSRRQENDQELSDSDDKECPLKDEIQAVDVGYGVLGAVSIVNPGKAEVKGASRFERLRHRKKNAARRVQVDGDSRYAHHLDPSPTSVTEEGRRSRLKFWKGKERKSTSTSDSSGELAVIARGEMGTVVHMTVETDGEAFTDGKTPDCIPSSGELQEGSDDGLDENRQEKGGKNKMQNIMHKISKKAHHVSNAISKMRSPSGKKRSLSGKNLGESPASTNHEETHDVPETSTSPRELVGATVVILQDEVTPPEQEDTMYGIETDEETHEFGAKTEDPFEVPFATPIFDISEVPKARKLRRVECFKDAANTRSPPAEKPSHLSVAFLASIKEEALDTQNLASAEHLKDVRRHVENVLVKNPPRTLPQSTSSVQGEGPATTAWSPRTSPREKDSVSSDTQVPDLTNVVAVGNPGVGKPTRTREPSTVSEEPPSSEPCTSKPGEDHGEASAATPLVQIPTHCTETFPIPSPGRSPGSRRREALKLAGSMGSASAKSFFSRIHGFIEGDHGNTTTRSLDRSSSNKELHAVTPHVAPETPNHEEGGHGRTEPRRDEAKEKIFSPEIASRTAGECPVLEEESEEVSGSAEVPLRTLLLSRSNCLSRESSFIPSLRADVAPATDEVSVPEVGKYGGDDLSSGSQHPIDSSVVEISLGKNRHEDSHGFLVSEDISGLMISSPRKSLKDASNGGSSSSNSFFSRINVVKEASFGRSLSSTKLTSATDASLHAPGEKEYGVSKVVGCSVERASEGSDENERPDDCPNDGGDTGSTSGKHLLSRTKCFKQPSNAGSVPFSELYQVTEARPVCNTELDCRKDVLTTQPLNRATNVDPSSSSVDYSSCNSNSSPQTNDEVPSLWAQMRPEFPPAPGFALEFLPESSASRYATSSRSTSSTELAQVTDVSPLSESEPNCSEPISVLTKPSIKPTSESLSVENSPRVSDSSSQHTEFLDSPGGSSRSPSLSKHANAGSTSAKSFFSRTKGFREPSSRVGSFSAREVVQVPEATLVSCERKGPYEKLQQ